MKKNYYVAGGVAIVMIMAAAAHAMVPTKKMHREPEVGFLLFHVEKRQAWKLKHRSQLRLEKQHYRWKICEKNPAIQCA